MKMIALIVGFVFVCIGGALLINNYNFTKDSKKVFGEIVGNKRVEGTGTNQRETYSPIIKFYDDNKIERVFTNSFSSTGKDRIGKRVEVYYKQKNPEKAKLYSSFSFYLFPSVFLIAGILCMLAYKIC